MHEAIHGMTTRQITALTAATLKIYNDLDSSPFAHQINNESPITTARDSGGFRHVQCVRPNRGLYKQGPHKRSGKFLHAGINGRLPSERE